MLLLEAVNIKKCYGDRMIISLDELKIQSGDKIGLVGLNGAGKSTLLDILAGKIEFDGGYVKRYCDIAYIKQFLNEEIMTEGKIFKEFNVQDKTDCMKLSGGESTRLRIADALSKNSMLLFADEPTANLDYSGIKMLKTKLRQFETLLLISHDRDLLDEICNKIIEIKDGKVSFYTGNYSFYKEQKSIETQREWFEYNQYIKERERLEEAKNEIQKKSKTMTKAPKRMGNSEARLHKGKIKEKRKKVDQTANIIKARLEKLDYKPKPQRISDIKFDFSLTDPPKNKIVISCDGLSYAYGSNVIFDKASFMILNGTKTAVIGDNGTGKTTLFNLINGRDRRINIVPKAVIGYFYQGFENLDQNRTILENVMKDSVQCETVVRTILARLLINGEDVYKKIQVLSGGERIKVSFAKLFVSNANVLLLDEPTNYLDLPSIEALENIISDYEGTILFVSHDKAFIDKVANRLLMIESKKATEYPGTLYEYQEQQRTANSISHHDLEKEILKMKLTEIISKITLPHSDKEVLETEYMSILEKLNSI